jgi:HK97 family phage major capsid protein
MSELTRKTEAGAGADAAADSEALAVNPQVAEWLGGLIKEEHLKLLDGDVAAKLSQAKRAVDNQKAIQALALGTSAASKPGRMTSEQVAEWFKCTAYRMSGQYRQPDATLDAEGLITQALTPSVGGAGGFLAPEDFKAEVIRKADEPSVIWPLITKRSTGLNAVTKPERSTYPTANAGSDAESSSSTSADELTETPVGYSQQSWTMRYFDLYHPVRLDMLDDSPVDVLAEITDAFGDALAVEHERQPLIGGGVAVGKPVGIFDTEAAITTVAIDAAMSLDAVLAFIQEVPQRYRSKAVVGLTSADYFALVEDLAKNVKSAQYLIEVLPKFMESAYVPTGKCVAGDWKYYVAYVNRMMHLVTSTRAKAFTLDIAVVEKWDGHPTVTDAFRIGTGIV